jgi:uncharacterized protein YjlB
MAITEIKEGELVLARLIPEFNAWGEGLKFFSHDTDYEQVGTWGYHNGKVLLPHTHNEVPREVLWTQEVLYVRRGRVRADVFDTSDKKVAELEVTTGDILILLRGGHGYQILEDNTQVLEVKNGPYVGADADRRRL